MTASVTSVPRCDSAVFFIFLKMMAATCKSQGNHFSNHYYNPLSSSFAWHYWKQITWIDGLCKFKFEVWFDSILVTAEKQHVIDKSAEKSKRK